MASQEVGHSTWFRSCIPIISVKDHMLEEGCYQSQCGILASSLRGIEESKPCFQWFWVPSFGLCVGWLLGVGQIADSVTPKCVALESG